tara:strand:- start:174 stop:440 length:267 start_codon:yes stop_codon:yes gene_type:complete
MGIPLGWAQNQKLMKQTLLATPEAAKFLCCSAQFLKRKRDSSGGFLENGKHYFYRGDSVNAAIIWNVDLVQKALNTRGLEARQVGGVK